MMADLIDSAAGELQQAGTRLASGGIRGSMKVAAGTTRLSVRLAGGMLRALVALLDAASQASKTRQTEGQVNLRRFTRVSDGKREVLPIQDAEVARVLTRELRRHGVTFAIEKNSDGTRTFHVQAKDAALIEHALTAAAVKVDERIARASGISARVDQTPEDVSLSVEAGTRTLALDENQKTSLAELLQNWGGGQGEPGVTDPIELAGEVRKDGSVILTPENIKAINSAVVDAEELSPHLEPIVAAAQEEEAALAASIEASDLARDPGMRAQDVGALQPATHDVAPELADGAAVVAEEQVASAERNPYLRDDLSREEDPALVEETVEPQPVPFRADTFEKDPLEDPRGSAPDGLTLAQQSDRTEDEEKLRPETQQPRRGVVPRERRSRDETRERVSRRIKTKVDGMKQGAGEAATRTPRTQGDEPRLPISRR